MFPALNNPTSLSADDIVAKFAGTPDGTKFLRDDGTLAAGGGTDASALTTGQVALARGGTNADLSATGGATHFLRQASAGAAITVGAITDGDLPAGSNAAAVAAKLPLGGGTMTGNVIFNDSLFIQSGNSGGTATFDIRAANFRFVAGGTQVSNFASNGLSFTATAAPTDYGIGRSSTPALTLRGPSAGGIECLAGSTSVQAKIGTTGIALPTDHTGPATGEIGVYRFSSSLGMQGAAAGGALMFGGSYASGGLLSAAGASHPSTPGQVGISPKAISLANSSQRIISEAATGKSGWVRIVDLTNHRVASYSINAGVPTKDSGHTQFVAGAPGAGEVGVELSSTTLRINNNSGGALLIAVNAILAY